jgi:pyridoxal 5'-phosphate synthase pdxT subunit
VAGSTPRIGVLALQGDVREHERALRAAGAEPVRVRRPDELGGVDGIVLPGGESTTLWKLSVAFDLFEPLRKALQAGLPAFGSCAGMIMLADRLEGGVPGQLTFGGVDMTVRRNAFGRQVESFETDLDMSEIDEVGGDRPYRAVFIRAPWVESVGDQVEVLARQAGRIVAVRQGAVLATAFHPELTRDPRLHELFVKVVRAQTAQEE